jgi:hypothetical protein
VEWLSGRSLKKGLGARDWGLGKNRKWKAVNGGRNAANREA